MLIFISAVAVVLIVSFLCSIFESVLLSLSRSQIEIIAQSGHRAGRLLADFKENMDMPIAAILILNTAAHTVGAAVAGASYAEAFSPSTLWLFSLLFTIAVLLFTEIVPKTLGVSYAQSLAVPVAIGIEWLTRLLRPLVLLSERISRSIRKREETPVTSVEEIRLLAALGRSHGVVGGRTAGMIIGAAELRALDAYDVLVPREDVRFLMERMSREEVLSLIESSGFSRFPLSSSSDLNDVVGVVYAKEIMSWLLSHESDVLDWNTLCREVTFVPRSLHLPELLRTIQENRRHMVVVVDEHGGVDGIVTLEDVIEEIVGEIYDESDVPLDDLVEEDDGSLVVDGAVDLRKLSAHLGLRWDPSEAVSTVGGLITSRLEKIPAEGDAIVWNGYQIEVVRADSRRVRRVSIRKEASGNQAAD